MALSHQRKKGATVFGINSKKFYLIVSGQHGQNGTAVRELDFHDTF